LTVTSYEIFLLVTLIYFFRFIREDRNHHRSFPACLAAVFLFFTPKKQVS
jgi:hypothetical protein